MTRLEALINLAFTRTQVMNTPIDKFVYFYGNLLAEDFMELFLMAVNGYLPLRDSDELTQGIVVYHSRFNGGLVHLPSAASSFGQ